MRHTVSFYLSFVQVCVTCTWRQLNELLSQLVYGRRWNCHEAMRRHYSRLMSTLYIGRSKAVFDVWCYSVSAERIGIIYSWPENHIGQSYNRLKTGFLGLTLHVILCWGGQFFCVGATHLNLLWESNIQLAWFSTIILIRH